MLIMKQAAPAVPSQGGTGSAPSVHRELGRPAAAHDWEEVPVTRQNWGRVSYGQEVGRAGRSSLSARSARPTSCPCRWPPLLLALW